MIEVLDTQYIRAYRDGAWRDNFPSHTCRCTVCGHVRYLDDVPTECYDCNLKAERERKGIRILYSPVSHTFEDDMQPDVDDRSVTTGCCVICGGDITSRRPHAKTCSTKCRKSLSRKG